MPDALGLSRADVEARQQRGQVNTVDQKSSRSIASILRTNLLSIANVILFAIVFILLGVGKPGDAAATGGVVFINVLVGTFQEFRAKRKLDRIALVTRPRVTVIRDGQPQTIDQSAVVVDDVLVLQAGDQAVVDGRLIADPRSDKGPGYVDIDESLLTGESDLVRKRPGDPILSGSFCVVGEGLYMAEKVGEDAFAQQMTEGARRYTVSVTPLQREISIIVRVLVALAIALTLLIGLSYAVQNLPFTNSIEDTAVIVSLVPQGLLLMITVAYALGAVRIAGQGALVQQSNAVESISHVDVLCLDKTGTLTTNRILFDAVHPLGDMSAEALREQLAAYVASVGANNQTARAVAQALDGQTWPVLAQIPFSSARKWAAATLQTGDGPATYVFGAPEVLQPALDDAPNGLDATLQTLTQQGLRVLMLAHSPQQLDTSDDRPDAEATLPGGLRAWGLVSFRDELRPDVEAVLNQFRRAGITLKLISGDNPDTVAALARRAGFGAEERAIAGPALAQRSGQDFRQAVRENAIFGRIQPQQKQDIVDALRQDGHYVAMLGDGVNDVLSLKKAQVGIAMEDGSQATRSVADIVLLGNKFSALPAAFLEGQRVINGMHDVTRLFLTRTLYTVLLIIMAGYIGSVFPLTPRHNFLLTSLPVGIPAFFLATWARLGKPRQSLLVSVSRFVLPVGFSLTVVSGFIWVLYLTSSQATVETGRTVLTTAALIGGLWVILLAEHEREEWHNGDVIRKTDRRRIVLAGLMFIVFVVIISVPGLRRSLELTTLSVADMGIIAASMSVWALAVHALLRYDILERLLIPNYGQPDGALVYTTTTIPPRGDQS